MFFFVWKSIDWVCKKWLDDNLSRKFISSSKSSISSSLFFVPKKDDFLQPCVNYGKVNDASVKDAFFLPLIKNMQSISGTKYFTKLNLRNGYHLIRVREGDE